MDLPEKATEILEKIRYATLATTDQDGQPWNSPVLCAIDDEVNIYWSSSPKSRHSRNILDSGKVFIVIYDSTSNSAEGVYLQCTAIVVEDQDEVRHALDLLGTRRGRPYEHLHKFIEDGPQRIFKATAEHIWMNDANKDADGDYVLDYRIELT